MNNSRWLMVALSAHLAWAMACQPPDVLDGADAGPAPEEDMGEVDDDDDAGSPHDGGEEGPMCPAEEVACQFIALTVTEQGQGLLSCLAQLSGCEDPAYDERNLSCALDQAGVVGATTCSCRQGGEVLSTFEADGVCVSDTTTAAALRFDYAKAACDWADVCVEAELDSD